MVKLINVLVLASGLAATAFSLERPVQRISGSSKIGATLSKQSSKFQHSTPTYLKAAEDSNADIVAAKVAAPVKASKSFVEKIWNDDTKLTGKIPSMVNQRIVRTMICRLASSKLFPSGKII